MLLVPPTLVLLWLTGLFSVALLGGGGWLVWEWYDNWAAHLPANPRYLIWGALLLAVSLLGSPLVTLFLGRKPRPGEAPMSAPAGATVHQIVRPDGTRLHAESFGPEGAPVLLFTHGWGLSSAEWFYACEHLGKRYRLLTWDLRGLGQSKGPDDHRYDLERMAGDLNAVLALAGDTPAVLCGHSIGGMTTLTFCRLFPEALGSRVAGLVLTQTTYTNPVRTAPGAPLNRFLQEPLLRPLCHLTVWLSPLVRVMSALSALNGSMALMNHLLQFKGQETRQQLGFTTALLLRASPAVVARGMLAMLAYEASDVLPTIGVPTLVIAASSDRATLPEASAYLQRHVPGAEALLLRPAGHMGLIEHHEVWAQAVDHFATRCFESARPQGRPDIDVP
ncbi:alpha/beta fold hydrolase [Deinococcus altitudinis]|uniref:alpha/beta fold hydrolase n=1 Tax=Deinococcus altitudinis TaxID=468914 RepID=UPI003891649E